MVTRGWKHQRELSSTYQSFADTGPTYSYLDLSRARSDESLMWSAGEEAAALVAELRASLAAPLVLRPTQPPPPPPAAAPPSEDKEDEGVVADQEIDDDDILDDNASVVSVERHRGHYAHLPQLPRGVPLPPPLPSFIRNNFERGSLRSNADRISLARSSFSGRSLSYTDLHSAATSAEDVSVFCPHPPRSPCTPQCSPVSPTPHNHIYQNFPSPFMNGYIPTSKSANSSFCNGGVGQNDTDGNLQRTNMKAHGGSWRSLVKMGGMSGKGKPVAAVKVVPPTVPDAALSHRHSGSSFSSGVYSAGGSDQRSSYSSSVSDDNPPPSPRSPARVNCDHGQLGRSNSNANPPTTNSNNNNNNSNNNSQQGNNSPSHFHNNQQFTFPNNQGGGPQFAHLLCPKTSPGSPHHVPPDTTYTYLTYQQQTSLEDQGIDVQSPGRSSPGSGSGSSTTGSTASSGGCRNSTTSLDSGRASSSTHTHQHRLSGQSYDSGSILRHSYHSSSSSLGSMEHDGMPHVNVPELLNNGVRDSEVLRAWLTDIRSDEYYEKFINAGYDMPTISRMTPEDLNAIGITKPAHRKKLTAEIAKLNISDRLPNFIPGRLEDWLSILRLEEYIASLKQQGYNSVEQVTQLTWEDLEDIGITKLGHQKKVMLAIKRVKDIKAGKKFSNAQEARQSQYTTHEIMISREPADGRDQFPSVPEFRTFSGVPSHHNSGEHNRISGPADPGGHYGVLNHYAPGVQYGPVGPPQAHVQPMPHQPGPYHPSGQYSGTSQGPSPPGGKIQSVPPHPLPGPGQVQYRPDIVAVQVRSGGRGRSAESLDEPIYGTYQTFHPDNNRLSHVQGPNSLGSLPPRPFPPSNMIASHPQRSMDDGDITPTNEYVGNYEGGGTLPRPRPANKHRPVAKVTAKTRVDVHEVPQFIKDGMNLKEPSKGEEIGMKELNVKTLNRQNSEKIYSSSQGSGSTNNTPQGTPKKLPPPPPRRSNSISETSKDTANREGQYSYLRRGLSYGYMGIKNNLQPDVTPDLPPPPAPPDNANHQHLPDDFPPPPPPLTCVTMANASRITSTITTSSITSDSLAISQTSTTPGEGEASPSFRTRRNDSNASFKSTSSTDSDSLPFANENAGTIKQRACRPHPGLSVLDTRNSPHSSPRASPALRRKDTLPPVRSNATSESTEPATKSEASSADDTGDVLNDIGNMLANLTDELDAMLEQELVLKN